MKKTQNRYILFYKESNVDKTFYQDHPRAELSPQNKKNYRNTMGPER